MHAAAAASNSDRPPAPTPRPKPSRAPKNHTRPLYISMREVAQWFGWSVLRTKRLLRHPSINAAIKRGGRWYTTRGLLLRRLPEEGQEALRRRLGEDPGED